MTRLVAFWSTLVRLARTGLAALVGRVAWDPPQWSRWLGAHATASWLHLRTHPAHAAGVALLVAAAAGGAYWYATRPTPHYVAYAVEAPGLTEYDANGVPTYKPLRVSFAESVAPLAQIEKPVTAGIDMSPAMAGTWTWTTDRDLVFTPQDDWPIDVRFRVRLNRQQLLAPGVQLEDYTFDAGSQPFSARISESQFHQDPQDPNLKKLVATLTFSHPVDAERLESRVSLAVARDAEYLGLTPDSRHFTVAYDKLRLQAFVHSAALAMPRDDTPMTLRIDQGVRAARGGNDTPQRLEAIVTIPGRTSLRFSDAQMTVVDNARYEPEQILLVDSSSPVTERALAGDALTARLLPVRHPRQPPQDRQPYAWGDVESIGADILNTTTPVTLAYVPSEDPGGTAHGFKFRAPVGRYLHVTVKDGVSGVGGYLSGKPYVATVQVEPYPQALTFLGQGSLLSVTGERRVGFLARDVGSVEVEIARVLPNQIQHVAPQMSDFSRPAMYAAIENKLVERFTAYRDYSGREPGKPVYDYIDLGEYLGSGSATRRGLFLVHIRGKEAPADDPNDRTEPDSEYDRDGGEYEGGGSIEDTRLVLVTDLGLIVKRAVDGARDVFVQSIRTGLPVEAARVEILGANGEPVLTAVTDATGRASLDAFRNLRRERRPLVVLVQKDGDVSFLPLGSESRRLELSRFDTGGVENAASAQELKAYLFSDRGIYRPGDTAHLGMVVRTADWRGALGGLPVVVEVSDPRGLTVSRTDLKLSATAFEDVPFTSQAGAPTGIYQATAYLVRDQNRREDLGSTSFTLQEFEPDRMKVRLDLSATPIEGWLKPEDVSARVHADHLFGEPASARRVQGELSLTAVLPRFSRYPDYRFQVGETLTEPYQESLAAAVTDAQGNAPLALDLKRFVGRAYRLNVLARTFEAEGGRNVAAQASAIVSAAPYLVGVKADGDMAFVPRGGGRDVRWMAVNQQLSPVAAQNLSLDWVQRRFVSVLTRQGNGTMRYVSQQRESVRDSRSVQLAADGTVFPLRSDEPGDFVFVLRNESGAELNRVYYSVAGQANLSRSLERDAELQVQLDRASYSAGDTIAVSIRAPYVGAGLITVERDKVYAHRWFKTTTTSSVQRITVPAGFEGNGYVSVQFVRDPASDQIFLSPLSYGVATFGPNLDARTQAVGVDVPRLVRPGSALTIRLRPARASRMAVLAVDEGILQVARYRNPDPLGYFFQKRRLEVDTRQILDLILPEFSQLLAMAPGGDADAGFARHLNPFNRKRKPPVAFWSGIVDVPAQGRDVRYTVPDYFNGRLRIVAVAVAPDRMGVMEAATEVKGDYVLTPNVPAMVAPGDEFLVSVGVFNNVAGPGGAVRIDAKPGRGVSLAGPASVEVTIAEKAEGVAEFRLKADAVLGSAPVTFVATRGLASASLEETISVRPAAAYRTHLTLGRVDGATTTAPLTRTMFSERRSVEAAVSMVPLVWGEGLTAYLSNYEYSCTEQLVSKGVAALVLATRPDFGRVRSPDARPLDQTYATLRGRANDSGGFGLWASTPQTAEFPTVYAAHFLVDARDKRQPVPNDVLADVNSWLARFAATPAPTLADGRLRAYAVYLLARQGIRATAALTNVEQELTKRHAQTWGRDLAAAYLASTYRLLQRTADADRIIDSVPWAVEKRDLGEEIYYDAVVHDAQLLYLLSRHFPARLGRTPPAALDALGAAVSNDRVNSLSAAYTLLALDAFAASAPAGATLGISEVGRDGARRALQLPAGAIPRVPVSEAAASLIFSKSGQIPGYYSLNESGFDRSPPAAATSQGLDVIREFVDAAGNAVPRVRVGDEFFIRLRLRATSRDRLEQVAVVDLLPGGTETVLELQPTADSSEAASDPATAGPGASALPVGVTARSTWRPDHLDLREDRLVLYGTITRDAGTFTYRVRATNAGVFQVPPAFAEGMYNRSVAGLSTAGRLEIVKP